MAKSGAYIRDVHSLEDLVGQIESTGDAMLHIDMSVGNYLQEVRDGLQRQLDNIHDRLDEAQRRLSQAEAALSACQASQLAASAAGMMCPSCVMEEQDVEMARMEVEKWQMRYSQGQQIVEDCGREIEEYNGLGGGHGLVQVMSDQQTPKATQLLRGCIEKIHAILSADVSVALRKVDTPKTEERITSDDERFSVFGKVIDGKKDRLGTAQESSSRTSLCPNCGRPIPLCICRNQ